MPADSPETNRVNSSSSSAASLCSRWSRPVEEANWLCSEVRSPSSRCGASRRPPRVSRSACELSLPAEALLSTVAELRDSLAGSVQMERCERRAASIPGYLTANSARGGQRKQAVETTHTSLWEWASSGGLAGLRGPSRCCQVLRSSPSQTSSSRSSSGSTRPAVKLCCSRAAGFWGPTSSRAASSRQPTGSQSSSSSDGCGEAALLRAPRRRQVSASHSAPSLRGSSSAARPSAKLLSSEPLTDRALLRLPRKNSHAVSPAEKGGPRRRALCRMDRIGPAPCP
mmetsp:Transcript_20586/g.29488  ORF Transcript_20586/g.29488 Transcript_20586/m.29488 type:complete len:284 (+) Transcript_20586:1271-2122(+)